MKRNKAVVGEPPTLAAKAIIAVSQLVTMGVVGGLGFLLVAESIRMAEASNSAMEWGYAIVAAIAVLAAEFSLVRSLVRLMKTPARGTDGDQPR